MLVYAYECMLKFRRSVGKLMDAWIASAEEDALDAFSRAHGRTGARDLSLLLPEQMI